MVTAYIVSDYLFSYCIMYIIINADIHISYFDIFVNAEAGVKLVILSKSLENSHLTHFLYFILMFEDFLWAQISDLSISSYPITSILEVKLCVINLQPMRKRLNSSPSTSQIVWSKPNFSRVQVDLNEGQQGSESA